MRINPNYITYFIVAALVPLISSLTLKLLTSKRLTKHFHNHFPVRKSYFDELNKIMKDKELTKKIRLYLVIEALMGVLIFLPILMVLPLKVLINIFDENNVEPTFLTVSYFVLLFFGISIGALGFSYFLSKTLIKIIFRIFNPRTDLDPEILSRYDLLSFAEKPRKDWWLSEVDLRLIEQWSLYYRNKKFNAVELDRKYAFKAMITYFACLVIVSCLLLLLS